MVIDNLKKHLISFAIGVKFRSNFSIEDELGSIIDKIVYKKNSFFNPKYFPGVISKTSEKILYDDKTDNKLVINSSNIILEINLPDDANEESRQQQVEQTCNQFDEQIITGIMREYKITQINRVGFINRYVFEDKELANSFIDRTIGRTIDGINDINLSFSRKYPVLESLAKANKNDYNNAIYNIIKKSDKEEIYIAIDYQKYYEPYLESSSQIEFKEFLNSVDYYNNKSVMKWLNKNYLGVKHEKV